MDDARGVRHIQRQSRLVTTSSMELNDGRGSDFRWAESV
jgi:hypothetical protein